MAISKWIFSVRYRSGKDLARHAVVGEAKPATVNAALDVSWLPADARYGILGCELVRDFAEDRLSTDKSGYYYSSSGWMVCIGPIHEVVP